MIRLIVTATPLVLYLSACGAPEFEANIPLKTRTDLSSQTIHSLTCTRGNSPFKMTVTPDGIASGRIVQTDAQRKARIPPIQFPASLRATGEKEVLLEIPVGPVTDEPVSEALSPVIKGGEIVLRGETFDCTNVRVRQYFE